MKPWSPVHSEPEPVLDDGGDVEDGQVVLRSEGDEPVESAAVVDHREYAVGAGRVRITSGARDGSGV